MKCLRVFGALPERPENLRFIIKIHVFSAKIPVGFFLIARAQVILEASSPIQPKQILDIFNLCTMISNKINLNFKYVVFH